MIPVVTVQYPGFNYIKNNLAGYLDRLLAGEIIAFRGANCSTEEQLDIMIMLGDIFGWSPNSISHEDPMYYETHHDSMDEITTNSKEALMLSWHVEHVGFENELYAGACWCMNLFKTDPDAGKTLFVDIVKVFESLSDEDQKLLLGAEVGLKPFNELDYKVETYKFVRNHWTTDKKLIRPVLNSSHETVLVSVDGEPPTEQDTKNFNRIFTFILDEVFFNEDIRYEHAWEEGDMLLLDVSRMAHAVTGGFKKGERKLTGIFGTITTEGRSPG
jgi:alpha-ketoglutarate-dependent taurine dioxygenase